MNMFPPPYNNRLENEARYCRFSSYYNYLHLTGTTPNLRMPEAHLKIPSRKLGYSSIPALGLNFSSFFASYSPRTSPSEKLEFLSTLYDNGVVFWDTANIYGSSEELIGEWISQHGKRSEIFIATKVGYDYRDLERFVNGSPEYISKAIDLALKRLSVCYIDLLYLHRPDVTVPIEVTVGAMVEAVKAGKVSHIGLRECSPQTLRRAHAVYPISAIQVDYSPFNIEIEDDRIELLSTARELGVSIVAIAPGPEVFCKSICHMDNNYVPMFEEETVAESFARDKAYMEPIRRVAERLFHVGNSLQVPPASIGLAWTLSQGSDVIPVVGMSNKQDLEKFLPGLKLQLSNANLSLVRKTCEEAQAQKSRFRPIEVVLKDFGNTPPLSTEIQVSFSNLLI
ncbi:NADP-dependent oxidoreductase domain superfamily protein [Abortiporus biennis]